MDFQTMSFEAVKISMNETDEGCIFKMAVHPDEVHPDLLSDHNGSRYAVVMVKLDDDELPDGRFAQREIERLKASCGALCRSRDFQFWILRDSGLDINEENAVCKLKELLSIKSRAEFSTNEQARSCFIQMREDFQTWLKNKPL